MGLSSFFQRKPSDDAAGPGAAAPRKLSGRAAGPNHSGKGDPAGLAQESPAVTQARTQARRRLIGAAVLLLMGVVLFSLIFETKPRPLPMDLPITVAPGKSAPAPQPVQSQQTPQAPQTPQQGANQAATQGAILGANQTASAPLARAPRPAPPMITETAEPEPARAALPPPVAQPASAGVKPQSSAQTSAPEPLPKPSAANPLKVAPGNAELSASAPAAPSSPDPAAARVVVQVGAFADDLAVRQTRQKVEKLGLKTYTQEVNTEAGKRVRVRVGPFATRDEAAQVLNKLKGAGLPGAVLAL